MAEVAEVEVAEVEVAEPVVVKDVEAEKKPDVAPPPMYEVWLLNDDFTPFGFVVDVLRQVFHKDQDAATKIMLYVHRNGKGLIEIYPRDIAQIKQQKVADLADAAGVPLRVSIEPQGQGRPA